MDTVGAIVGIVAAIIASLGVLVGIWFRFRKGSEINGTANHGPVQSVGQQGGQTAQTIFITAPQTLRDTREVRQTLARFTEEAGSLTVWAKDLARPEDKLIVSYNEWHEQLRSYLRGNEHLGEDYATTLHQRAGLKTYSGGYGEILGENRAKIIIDLEFDRQRLMEFIADLRQK